MPKSPAERKAAQRARQAASGEKKLELKLDSQEGEMLAQNCAARRPGREVYQERRFQFIGKRQLEYWADIDKSTYQQLPESERRVIYVPAQ